MSDRTPARAPLDIIGRAGIVAYNGTIWHDDPDRAWRGGERDRTIAAMITDPVLGAILHAVEMLVRRVDWTVEPADDSAAAKAAAEFVRECLDDMDGYWPGDTLAAILSYIPWGWWVGEIVYKRRGGPDAADATQRSRFSDGRIGWRKWATRPQTTRAAWRFDDAGDAVAFVQRDPATLREIELPLERCLHVRYSSKTNSPEGWTPLRTAYTAWYYKRNLQRIEAIGIERDLAGIPVMRVPGRSIETNDAIYQAAQRIVTGLRNDQQAGVVLASDRDEHGNYHQELTLMASGGSRAFDTDTIIRRYANEVVTVFLANVMRTGQDGIGALALAEEQSSLFQQAIGSHLDIIGDAINTQAIPRLFRLNGLDGALAPQLKHANIDSTDVARLGAYLMQLASTGLLIDTPELRRFVHEAAGLPVGGGMGEGRDAEQAARAAMRPGGEAGAGAEQPAGGAA